MVGFNPYSVKSTSLSALDLHSIMVGFNHGLCNRHYQWYLHLHSIMVGFNPCHSSQTLRTLVHLHSIMVGFNRSFEAGRLVEVKNLHSIMVGFNRKNTVRSKKRHLHLHSIMVGFNHVRQPRPWWDKPIYIPLWSDSISRRISFRVMTTSFTFHYGRIQSKSRSRCCGRRYDIYIPLWSDSILCTYCQTRLFLQDLHSIMVGFNLLSCRPPDNCL